MATTVRLNVAVLDNRATPRLANVCVAPDELGTTVANVGISLYISHFVSLLMKLSLNYRSLFGYQFAEQDKKSALMLWLRL